jgi:hypothetical protein
LSTSIANITWTPTPGSTSTLVEYRVAGTTTWATPGSPTNPTIFNVFPLTITSGVHYDVRLTTNGLSCGPSSVTLQIINPGGSACCPATYTLSVDATYCFKNTDIPATPPSSSENTVAVQHIDYSAWGTLIYNVGYALNGTGPFTQIAYSNPFWVNGSGFPTGSGLTTTAGPLNRAGVWSTTTSDGQVVGFTVCVTLPVAGTYYIGTAGDNYSTITVDGNNVLVMDPIAIATYLNAHGYGGLSTEATFRFWHIYPVVLTAGDHILQVVGSNVTGVASIGAEVYNATSADLQAASSYAILGSKLIFSSKDFIGQPIQIGNGGIGYTCPAGYSLVLCEGSPFCRQTLTTSTISC